MSTNFTYNDEIYHSKGPWKKHKYVKKVGNVYYYNKQSRGPYTPDKWYNERRSEEGKYDTRIDRDSYSEMNVNDLFSFDVYDETSSYNHGVHYVNNHNTHYIGRIEQTYRAGKSIVDKILKRLKKKRPKSRKRP